MRSCQQVQGTLLFLCRCIQQNLRHLQRSIKTDNLEGCWDGLDDLLQRSLLTLRSSSSSLPSDRETIILPVRLGGLGILSHGQVSPQARATSQESADRFLAPLLALPSDDTVPLTSQAARISQVVVAHHTALLDSLLPHQQFSLANDVSPWPRCP
jgi:hypothetical protein